ncbi:MAG TPA: hypothetical protein VMG12_28015, partial [Polyangiaceae bacterium]|nr:hypothetical protein [Polyangiaceae bacterium]
MANVTLECLGFRPVLFVAALASGLAVGCGSDGSGDTTQPPLGGAGLGGSASGVSGSAGASGSSGAANGGTAAGSGGSTAANGGSEGQPDVDGISGSSGTAGASGMSDAGSGGMEPDPGVADERPFFSFFITSQAGLFGLPAGEFAPAPSATNGYGGNLGGLAGADEICTMLARASNPSDRKTWRAFLSTSGFDGSTPVD